VTFDPFVDLTRISSDDTVGLYLKEMSRVPLLNVEEELDLAKRIERGGKDARRDLAAPNGSNPTRRPELESCQ
jgi:RNA polymerase primary sigma factor